MKRFAFLVAGLVLALGWAGWLGAIRDPAVVHYRVELAGLKRPLRLVHLISAGIFAVLGVIALSGWGS